MAGEIEVYYYTQDGTEYEAESYIDARDRAYAANGQVIVYKYAFDDSELLDDFTHSEKAAEES